jgi:hypothetical protein
MVNLKIVNVPAGEGESLCRSCRYVHMQKGHRESDETIFCEWTRPMRLVTFNVRVCTDYSDRNHPSRWDLEQTAWILVQPKEGGPIGFKSPAERKDDEEDNDLAARS